MFYVTSIDEFLAIFLWELCLISYTLRCNHKKFQAKTFQKQIILFNNKIKWVVITVFFCCSQLIVCYLLFTICSRFLYNCVLWGANIDLAYHRKACSLNKCKSVSWVRMIALLLQSMAALMQQLFVALWYLFRVWFNFSKMI